MLMTKQIFLIAGIFCGIAAPQWASALPVEILTAGDIYPVGLWCGNARPPIFACEKNTADLSVQERLIHFKNERLGVTYISPSSGPVTAGNGVCEVILMCTTTELSKVTVEAACDTVKGFHLIPKLVHLKKVYTADEFATILATTRDSSAIAASLCGEDRFWPDSGSIKIE